MDLDLNAAQRALGTPEILEMVLDSLPPIDVLLLQRTSHLWHSLIADSPRLQRHLFMRPDWHLEAKLNDPKRPVNKPGERPRNNLMLRSILGGMYPTMTLKLITPNTHENLVDSASELDVEVRPKQPDPNEEAKMGHWAWDVSIAFPADRLPTSPGSKPAAHYERASWRRMYISQPPATCLHLCRRWQRATLPAVVCEEGITMGDFLDKATKAKDHWDELFIGGDRDWHFEGPVRYSHLEKV